MRTIVFIAFWGIFLTLSLTSCSDSKKSAEEIKLSESRHEFLLKLYEKKNDDYVWLLSMKYGLNKEITEKIITKYKEFDEQYDFIDLLILSGEEFERYKDEYLNRPPLEKIIKSISSENNIEEKLIASLVIDYKVLSGYIVTEEEDL